MASIDEQAVKNRLLIDGDGNGDDRRLNILAKQVIKWSSSPFPQDAADEESAKKMEEDDAKHHASLIAQLLLCRWNDQKTKLIQSMTSKEAENYEELYQHIKEEIDKAGIAIKETKEELKKAQKIRRNRLEYDALAVGIKKHPDRNYMEKRLQEMDLELEKLREEEEALDAKLQERKKQFHLLVNTIHELQGLLEQDDEDASTEPQSEVVSEDGDVVVMDVN